MGLRASCFVLLAASCVSGCVLDEVDLEGRPCPCADGWVCDATRDVCVREGADAGAGLDAGSTDAGPEAGAPDAGRDAGATDASRPDAAADDAGDRDGGALDGGALDGAALDAGPGDAGAADAGVDGGGLDDTVCDELVGALFCDGFEAGLSAWTGVTTLDGTVTTPGARSYRGAGAMECQTTAAGGKASAYQILAAPVSNGELWARAYFYVPSTLDSEGVSLLFVGETTPPYLGLAVQLASDDLADVYVGTVDRLAAGTRAAMPRDTWVCVQLALTVRNTGRVRAWVDGVPIADESPIDTLPGGGLGQLIAGIEFSAAAQLSARVLVDEVALSRTMIPCD